MPVPTRAIMTALTVLVAAVVVAFGTYHLVLRMALEHQAASPELRMAAAMSGLFSGGLVAVLVLLIMLRWRSMKQ